MEEIFFTSDTHFFHKKIQDFCPNTRRGKDAEEMTELMIQAWNNKVKRTDRVYHCGDFSFGTKEKTLEVLSRLNGFIHITLGNHDRQLESFRSQFASMKVYNTTTINGQRIVMMHYPIESWDRMQHGTIHLHGHLHGDSHHECRILKNRFDIGIDTRRDREMAPYHFDEVMERIKEQNEWLSRNADS